MGFSKRPFLHHKMTILSHTKTKSPTYCHIPKFQRINFILPCRFTIGGHMNEDMLASFHGWKN